MIEEGAQRRTDHRLAGNAAILFRDAPASAFAAPSGNDNGCNQFCHKCSDPNLGSQFLINARSFRGHALAHVGTWCEAARKRLAARNRASGLLWTRFAQIRDIAVQHLRCSTIWLNYMQTLINAYCVGSSVEDSRPVPEIDVYLLDLT
jgi:hypothetical protein